MQLFKAKVFCSECSTHHVGPAMSDEDNAIMFLNQDHMEEYGHWPVGAIEVFEAKPEKPGKK